MEAAWMAETQIGYWSDIDSWGLTFLSEARTRQPHLQALMMDEPTLLRHQARMVDESRPSDTLPDNLTAAEEKLFCRLRDGHYGGSTGWNRNGCRPISSGGGWGSGVVFSFDGFTSFACV